MTDEELEAEVTKRDAEFAEKQQAAIAAKAGEPVEEFREERLVVLAQAVSTALEVLTAGQVARPPVPIESNLERIPAPLFAAVASIAGVLEQLDEGESYRFDPAKLTSNDAIADAAAKISGAGRDRALRRAMSTTPPAAEPADVPEADDNTDEEVY